MVNNNVYQGIFGNKCANYVFFGKTTKNSFSNNTRGLSPETIALPLAGQRG